ncbi:MAG TPA: endo alpha-1,4 polygalactosaminidase [Chloroflexia bacterium]|nr:endo alpha-1,4 polygalactosaminidase [Chloroflexia bacterium]
MVIFKGLKKYWRWFAGASLMVLLATLLLNLFFTQHSEADAGLGFFQGGNYRVNYTVDEQWNDGYSTVIKLTNTGSTPVRNWTISWELSQDEHITDKWNTRCSTTNNIITCNNTGANAVLRANNRSVQFGVSFSSNGKVSQPVSFTVNGVKVVSNNPTPTSAPATATAPNTATPKPATATPTATATPQPATATPTTPAVPVTTATPKPTVSATATPTPKPTIPATATPTPKPTIPATPTPVPTQSPTGSWWKPTTTQPIHWHWQLSQDFAFPRDVLPNVSVYDIDGELTSADTVAKLHALGPDVKVICYFDAGVYENYRSDASRFPKSVIGNTDTGWDGSYWLDIRQTDVILPIMQDRMQHWCKDKGFDAIEPDETEVWSNNSGFPITKAQNNLYNQKIADMAHSMGLSVGLKGNTTEAPDLWQYFDWSLNEQCWQYQECDNLKSSFLDHGKAVFNIEYNTNPDCATANAWHMNSARRDLNLVGPTSSGYRYSPCVPDSVNNW